MNKKLYNSIIHNISKSIKSTLNENDLFDDDFDDMIDSESVLNHDLIDKSFKELLLDTLCKPVEYYTVMEDPDDGLPYILEDPENPVRFYVAPYQTYRSCGFGPRKRKKYTLNFFYRYILEFLEDGTLNMSIAKLSRKPNVIINEVLYQFLSRTNIPIKTLTYHYASQNEYKVTEEKLASIWIFDGTPRGKQKNLTDKFVYNFPELILPGGTHPTTMDPTSSLQTSLWRNWFSSDKKFLEFVKKLIDSGFSVADLNYFVYNENTFEERKSELLSGEQDRQIQDERDSHARFMMDELGDEYYKKFNMLHDYFESQKRQMYLKSFNTLRTTKINVVDTIYNLRKDNKLLVPEFNETEDEAPYLLINRQILWKIFYILKKENLNDWRVYYDYTDCISGCESEWGYKYPDLNDLPIKLNNIKDLYTLYYVIAKAITLTKGIYEIDKGSTPGADEVEKLNEGENPNMREFKFYYLNNQLKTIIDKACKKFKLKVK